MLLKKHIINEHPNEQEKVEFDMILTGTFNKTTERIIEEGIRIKNHEKETLLNSKSEFHGPSVTRRIAEGKGEECDKCMFKSKYRTTMLNHKKSVHVNTVLHCDQCRTSFNENDRFQQHVRDIHQRDKSLESKLKFKCDNCQEDVETKEKLDRHAMDKHKERQISKHKERQISEYLSGQTAFECRAMSEEKDRQTTHLSS